MNTLVRQKFLVAVSLVACFLTIPGTAVAVPDPKERGSEQRPGEDSQNTGAETQKTVAETAKPADETSSPSEPSPPAPEAAPATPDAEVTPTSKASGRAPKTEAQPKGAAAPAATARKSAPAQASRQPKSTHEVICETVEIAAAENEIPVTVFTRLIWQESRFRPDAVSPAGAQGIAQFMPRTAAGRGVDPFNPVEALHHAAGYLGELLKQFGNLGLAAAAYNGGPKRVQDWLKKRGQLPRETREYVETITGHSARDWSAAKRFQYTRVAIPGQVPCPNLPAMQHVALPVVPTSEPEVPMPPRQAQSRSRHQPAGKVREARSPEPQIAVSSQRAKPRSGRAAVGKADVARSRAPQASASSKRAAPRPVRAAATKARAHGIAKEARSGATEKKAAQTGDKVTKAAKSAKAVVQKPCPKKGCAVVASGGAGKKTAQR